MRKTYLYLIYFSALCSSLLLASTLVPASFKGSKETAVTRFLLSENIDGGKVLQLNNGCFYLIHPEDVSITQVWITPIPITVGESRHQDYPIELIDLYTKTPVRARELSPQKLKSLLKAKT